MGLTAAEVAERVERGEVNLNMELKTKSVRELVLENLLTLFNLINVILAILVIIAGSWKKPYLPRHRGAQHRDRHLPVAPL